jgi:hypothetical protein
MDQDPRVKPSREQALAIAERRKAARHMRTFRIRRAIAVAAVAAFIGPFGFIYAQLATGHDPALASGTAVASTASGTTSNATSTTVSSAGTSQATQTTAPAPVTTQQS